MQGEGHEASQRGVLPWAIARSSPGGRAPGVEPLRWAIEDGPRFAWAIEDAWAFFEGPRWGRMPPRPTARSSPSLLQMVAQISIDPDADLGSFAKPQPPRAT